MRDSVSGGIEDFRFERGGDAWSADRQGPAARPERAGDLALVDATPIGFTERARVPAIDGKTWNHPVLVDDILLARNTEEMAALIAAPW